jgi:hypothetical protein
MNGEQLRKAQSIFEELAGLPAPRRDVILEERCGDDRELRAFVERVLASHDEGIGNFLESPEIEIMKLFRGHGTHRDSPSE